MSMSAWIRAWEGSGEYLENIDGVAWHEAPKPWRWHRCKPQTRGRFSDLAVDRCACGGMRYMGDDFWIERNSRRRR